MHFIAVRGTLVANDVALRLLQQDTPVPFYDQKWWHRCFAEVCGLKGKSVDFATENIQRSVRNLFPGSYLDGSGLWPFVSELARDFVTASSNHVISNTEKPDRNAPKGRFCLAFPRQT
jgi:hypothetical protein